MLRVKHNLLPVRCNSSAHAAFIREHGLLEILKFIASKFAECTYARLTRLIASILSVNILQPAPASGSHSASNRHLECSLYHNLKSTSAPQLRDFTLFLFGITARFRP